MMIIGVYESIRYLPYSMAVYSIQDVDDPRFGTGKGDACCVTFACTKSQPK